MVKKTYAGVVAAITALAIAAVMALVGGAAGANAAGTASSRVVSQNNKGNINSRVLGETGNGREVTGSFVPLQFSKRNGHLRVRGLIQGVVHNKNGTTQTFSALRTMRVKSAEGNPVSGARASCDVLNLVLGPLDLDLLGLQVHLDKVVLNIVAQSGAGNLLGNLLCTVAGLLDGGGALTRITNLLNSVLGILRSGV